MAPLRRYLRITKYSVLECRIYLDNPALAQSWLLNPRDPVLPRVIESVRPLVLPKLREERERSRKKSTKKRGIKDTVTEDDFEVSIFLTETSTRHSLLYKHKHFHDTSQTKLTSTSTKLTGASREAPVDVDDELAVDAAPILREESDDDVMALDHIPTLDQDETAGAGMPTRASKRRRGRTMVEQRGDGGAHDAEQDSTDVPVVSDEDDDLFVSSDEDNEATGQRPAKRRKDTASVAEDEMARDDKKKLAMDISYEGFAIYGRVLCLVVKRRGDGAGNKGKGVAVAGGGRASRAGAPAGQAMMENWISSTQMPEAAGNELSEGA